MCEGNNRRPIKINSEVTRRMKQGGVGGGRRTLRLLLGNYGFQNEFFEQLIDCC